MIALSPANHNDFVEIVQNGDDRCDRRNVNTEMIKPRLTGKQTDRQASKTDKETDCRHCASPELSRREHLPGRKTDTQIGRQANRNTAPPASTLHFQDLAGGSTSQVERQTHMTQTETR